MSQSNDGGSKYVIETGDGYVGTYTVKASSSICEVNAVTIGHDRGDDLALVADGDRTVRITTDTTTTDALRVGIVNDDGFLSVGRSVQHHLDVADGGDIRLYETNKGHALVNADDDPFVATDGGDAVQAEWTLTCLGCDFEQEISTEGHPRAGPPDIVRDRVTTHKHAVDKSHIVRVEGRLADRDDTDTIDPSLVTDGGHPISGGRIDPLVCPRGHHSISLSANRFSCETCRRNDFETTAWDRSELVDLRHEEPPLTGGAA